MNPLYKVATLVFKGSASTSTGNAAKGSFSCSTITACRWAPAVDGPGSSDAIADAKRKVLFTLPGPPRGPPRGPPTTQLCRRLRTQTRHKILLILCLRTSQWTRRKTRYSYKYRRTQHKNLRGPADPLILTFLYLLGFQCKVTVLVNISKVLFVESAPSCFVLLLRLVLMEHKMLLHRSSLT